MSRVRILMLVLLGLVSGLVACVWVVPGMLDWNRYRDGIAALASSRVGRPVHIGGAITLHLLPQPILTAADVSVEDDGDGIGMQAGALRLRVGLGALLAGTVDARELTLQKAELRLPWPPPAGALSQRPPSWITGLRAQVEDGRIQVGALVLDHVEGTLSTDPDTGTLSAAGVGQAGPRTWRFTARLARPGRDGAAGLDLSLDGQGKLRDTGGTFSGQLAADGALSGRVAGRGPDLSQLMAAPAVPWRGDGRLSASGGLAVADELALEIGGAPARGAVALRVTPEARLDLAIAAGRLDLDAWLPALLARTDPLGSVLPTGIDLSAEAATLAGGTLRRVRAAIDLSGETMLLREVAAVLPGDGQVDLSGQLTRAQFTGPVRVTAPDLRTTLRWLQALLPGTAPDLPEEVLRRAELSARMVAGNGAVELTELRGTIDGAALTGSAAFRTGARPTLAASLVFDRMAVEGWIPDSWRGGPALSAIEPAMTRLRSADSDIKVQVRDASWSGIRLGSAALEMQTEVSRVVLRRLEARPLGGRLAASGQLTEGTKLVDGRVELSAEDLATLRPLAAALPPSLAVLLHGPGSALVQAAGPPDALAARLTIEASDLRVEAQPVLNLVTRRAAGGLTVHHPGAPRLLDALGLGAGTVDWLGDGSFSLVGQAAVSPGRLELTGATLAAGAARATLRLALENHRLTGQVSAETLPLPVLGPRSPEPLPLAWLRGWQAALRIEAAQLLIGLAPALQQAGTDLILDNGTLRLSRITGKLAEGTLTAGITLETNGEAPRLAVQAQATGLSIPGALAQGPVDLLAGQLDTTLDLAATGHSPAALLSTLGGTGRIRLQNGLLQGFDLSAATAALALPAPKEALDAVRQALLAGTTPVTAAEARLGFDRGVLTLDGTIAAEPGTGTIAGSIDLRTRTPDLRLTLHPAVPNAPALGLRLAGPAESLQRTPELAGLARWLAERPAP